MMRRPVRASPAIQEFLASLCGFACVEHFSLARSGRDAVEGDAGGRGFEGGKHGGRCERAQSVFVVRPVHHREQAGAALRVFKAVEEIEGVEAA
jgi:hypothetical protein